MKDTIIKGSGNSRTLASVPNLLTLYPTYEDFARALVNRELPIDLGPLNDAGLAQRGTDLNKPNLLSDATAALLGGPETPDEALQVLLGRFGEVKDYLKYVQFNDFILTLLPEALPWAVVGYGAGKFIALPNADTGQKAAYSTDGINWTPITATKAAWRAIAYGNGKFVAVASGSSKAIYSTDGINWTEVSLGRATAWTGIAYGNGRFVAVSQVYYSYSTDGINWTLTEFSEPIVGGYITYGNGKFVTVGTNRNGAYSTNGANWTLVDLKNNNTWSGVAYGNGKFVAIGGAGNTSHSTDGINWTENPISWALGAQSFSAITFGDGVFVAIPNNGSRAVYSKDGINWSPARMPDDTTWKSITYGNGKFVAVSGGMAEGAYSEIIGKDIFPQRMAGYTEDDMLRALIGG